MELEVGLPGFPAGLSVKPQASGQEALFQQSEVFFEFKMILLPLPPESARKAGPLIGNQQPNRPDLRSLRCHTRLLPK